MLSPRSQHLTSPAFLACAPAEKTDHYVAPEQELFEKQKMHDIYRNDGYTALAKNRQYAKRKIGLDSIKTLDDLRYRISRHVSEISTMLLLGKTNSRISLTHSKTLPHSPHYLPRYRQITPCPTRKT